MELWTDFWRFSSARGLADLVNAAGQWSGVVLVGALASARGAGIYGAVNRVSFAGMLALTSANAALAPRIAHAFAVRNQRGVELLYSLVTSWAVGIGGPVFVILAFFPGEVLRVFGGGLTSGRTALVILAVAMLWNLLTGPVTVALLMSGHSRLNLLNAAVSVAGLLGSGILLVPRYGVTGAALSWSVGIILDNGLALLEIKHVLRLQVLQKNVMEIFASAVLVFGGLGLLLRLFGKDDLVGLIFEVGVAVPLYGLCLHRFDLAGPLLALVRSGDASVE